MGLTADGHQGHFEIDGNVPQLDFGSSPNSHCILRTAEFHCTYIKLHKIKLKK